VAPVTTTCMITHFISYSTFAVSLYINSCIYILFAYFYTTFLSAVIATSISMHVFSFLFLITISGLVAITSLFLIPLTLSHLHVHILAWACVSVYHYSVLSMPSALHNEQCKCAPSLSCFIQYSIFSRMGHSDVT
jgi:hypothetical protein